MQQICTILHMHNMRWFHPQIETTFAADLHSIAVHTCTMEIQMEKGTFRHFFVFALGVVSLFAMWSLWN